jgi:Flp pilus assembly pilin Flp
MSLPTIFRFFSTVAKLIRREDGAVALEYGLLLVVVALGCLSLINVLGSRVTGFFALLHGVL